MTRSENRTVTTWMGHSLQTRKPSSWTKSPTKVSSSPRGRVNRVPRLYGCMVKACRRGWHVTLQCDSKCSRINWRSKSNLMQYACVSSHVTCDWKTTLNGRRQNAYGCQRTKRRGLWLSSSLPCQTRFPALLVSLRKQITAEKNTALRDNEREKIN